MKASCQAPKMQSHDHEVCVNSGSGLQVALGKSFTTSLRKDYLHYKENEDWLTSDKIYLIQEKG